DLPIGEVLARHVAHGSSAGRKSEGTRCAGLIGERRTARRRSESVLSPVHCNYTVRKSSIRSGSITAKQMSDFTTPFKNAVVVAQASRTRPNTATSPAAH